MIIVHYPLLESALYLVMVDIHLLIMLKKESDYYFKCDQIILLL